jgi:hypothetical protein
MRWGAEDYSEWEVKRRLWRRRQRLLKKVGIAAVFLATFAVTWMYLPQSMDIKRVLQQWIQERLARKLWIYYPNCTTARYLGVTPIRRGDPGYRQALDADNDGVACEPLPRWAR